MSPIGQWPYSYRSPVCNCVATLQAGIEYRLWNLYKFAVFQQVHCPPIKQKRQDVLILIEMTSILLFEVCDYEEFLFGSEP